MTSYKQKLLKVLADCKTLEDFEYVLEKVQTTEKINRRTIKGREETAELEKIVGEKREEAIKKYNLIPF